MNETEKARLLKMSVFESEYYSRGYKVICGIDEAGRGPLAGPVVAACVILSQGTMIQGLNDSKKVPKRKHEELYNGICQICLDRSVSIISHEVIDDMNILNATISAMLNALNGLSVKPDVALIDYVRLPLIKTEQLPLTRGDSLSVSIAAASILAKHTRDKIMKEYSMIYPCYGFDRNAGYGTPEHIEALKKYGPCEIHRRSFIKNFI